MSTFSGNDSITSDLGNMLESIKQTFSNNTFSNNTISNGTMTNNTVDILMIILQKTVELHEEIKDIKVSLDEHRFIVEDFNDDMNQKSKIAGIIGIVILVLGMCCCCLIGCKTG